MIKKMLLGLVFAVFAFAGTAQAANSCKNKANGWYCGESGTIYGCYNGVITHTYSCVCGCTQRDQGFDDFCVEWWYPQCTD